ncbi:DinB family protein [Bacillus sp. BGMRC 2118]|nr:DinB family protein [Bacillus sp. BGMRC 2118]
MDFTQLFLIAKKEGFSLEFSRLVSQMNYIRGRLKQEVKDLTVEELDFRMDEESNSIGMLLAHIHALNAAYNIETFEGRELTEEDINRLNPALQLGQPAQSIKGYTNDYYLSNLEESRKYTFDQFKALSDEWLYVETDFWFGNKANNYFKWTHVMTDEQAHVGQIRLLKKFMSRNT